MKYALVLLLASSTAFAAGACDKGPEDFFLLDTTPQAKSAGLNYVKELTAAFHKDPTALGKLFDITPHLDGSGAQTHANVLFSLLKCWGDRSYAAVLNKMPKTICGNVLKQLDYETEETGGFIHEFPITESLKKKCL